MSRILTRKFFERPTVAVAKSLLGKYLCRFTPSSSRGGRGKTICKMITEVEAYDGPKDKASHASRGMTPRNKVMFGPAGYWYVYFTYGMHWMLNIVTGKRGYPAAILIRGVESMSQRINGPARITKLFKIDKSFNEKSANQRAGLWVEDRGVKLEKSRIKKSKRIGVGYAGPVWSNKPYRFYLIHNPLDEK